MAPFHVRLLEELTREYSLSTDQKLLFTQLMFLAMLFHHLGDVHRYRLVQEILHLLRWHTRNPGALLAPVSTTLLRSGFLLELNSIPTQEVNQLTEELVRELYPLGNLEFLLSFHGGKEECDGDATGVLL
ncbi:hypothetical protein BH11PAT4_BH11PAT4_5570 [soil metagenome]